jgi:hypothetical protein
MMTGGRNSEMLLSAAALIETLTLRATKAEQLYREQQEDQARNRELREVAELATQNLIAEVSSLKAQLAERERQAEIERQVSAEESRRVLAMAQDAEARLAAANAEIETMRQAAAEIDETVATVPVQSLQLARAQFDFLADGFAKNGDVISQTICEIGGCAIDQALAANRSGELYRPGGATLA